MVTNSSGSAFLISQDYVYGTRLPLLSIFCLFLWIGRCSSLTHFFFVFFFWTQHDHAMFTFVQISFINRENSSKKNRIKWKSSFFSFSSLASSNLVRIKKPDTDFNENDSWKPATLKTNFFFAITIPEKEFNKAFTDHLMDRESFKSSSWLTFIAHSCEDCLTAFKTDNNHKLTQYVCQTSSRRFFV